MAVDFWRVIGSNSISSRSDVEAALSDVKRRLGELDLAELVEFQDRLGQHLDLLDTSNLAEIPVELPDGRVFEQTDDHFLYARCACLLAGEGSVRAVLEDELRFAEFVAPRLMSAEMLLYAARNEYESRTGQRMSGKKAPD